MKTQRGKHWVDGENCNLIEEHPARGEGDKWFYDVYTENDDGFRRVIRVFDPLEVELQPEDEEN